MNSWERWTFLGGRSYPQPKLPQTRLPHMLPRPRRRHGSCQRKIVFASSVILGYQRPGFFFVSTVGGKPWCVAFQFRHGFRPPEPQLVRYVQLSWVHSSRILVWQRRAWILPCWNLVHSPRLAMLVLPWLDKISCALANSQDLECVATLPEALRHTPPSTPPRTALFGFNSSPLGIALWRQVSPSLPPVPRSYGFLLFPRFNGWPSPGVGGVSTQLTLFRLSWLVFCWLFLGRPSLLPSFWFGFLVCFFLFLSCGAPSWADCWADACVPFALCLVFRGWKLKSGAPPPLL